MESQTAQQGIRIRKGSICEKSNNDNISLFLSSLYSNQTMAKALLELDWTDLETMESLHVLALPFRLFSFIQYQYQYQ